LWLEEIEFHSCFTRKCFYTTSNNRITTKKINIEENVRTRLFCIKWRHFLTWEASKHTLTVVNKSNLYVKSYKSWNCKCIERNKKIYKWIKKKSHVGLHLLFYYLFRLCKIFFLWTENKESLVYPKWDYRIPEMKLFVNESDGCEMVDIFHWTSRMIKINKNYLFQFHLYKYKRETMILRNVGRRRWISFSHLYIFQRYPLYMIVILMKLEPIEWRWPCLSLATKNIERFFFIFVRCRCCWLSAQEVRK
jgi:hypothetical protein